jgi:cytochrome c-type biogenesis protein CcmH/NrfG
MLGEVRRQRGERDKAIAAYRRALELDPQNPEARRRLTELGALPAIQR